MENNIEEAIKVMEHWIEYEKNNKEKINRADELINIKEIILSDYKRVLKENRILKEEKEQAWEEWNNLEQGSYETEQKLKQQIKESQKENEELKEDRDKFKKALGKRITYCNELEKDLFENGSNYVIPKQKVKDKIEELKQERDETYTKFLGGNRTDENLSTRGKMIEGGIKVLQELLEESEE